jgi:hypothetical protein
MEDQEAPIAALINVLLNNDLTCTIAHMVSLGMVPNIPNLLMSNSNRAGANKKIFILIETAILVTLDLSVM